MRGLSVVAGVAALFAQSVAADLDPIVVKGAKFFYKTNGTEFFIQGVAYQQDYSTNGSASTTANSAYSDPLANEARCKVDIPLMKELNMNTIRVYAVDPTKDHSACMKLLQDNGIYIVADLGQPGLSINRDSPAWNTQLYARYTSVIDMFAPYSNVIGFFAGNEVSNNKTNTNASAFVKAAVRDTKAYIKAKNYRPMYVGYATNDDADIRANLETYFNCGDTSEAIDFWGYNIYSWCGDSSFTKSGYDQRVAEFKNYSVPTFFAEYGCNTVQPRKFTEVKSIYSSQMTDVFSGGIVYMFFQEANDYGLVQVSGSTVSKLSDFNYLKAQMATISPTGVQASSYNPTNSPQACPAVQSGVWEAKASPLPPVANPQLCSCMYNSLQCVVKSSQAENTYGTLFNQVCGYGSSCAGIAAIASNATYGAYSACNSTQQLSFAFNQYFLSQNKASDACNFGGAATTKAASTASGCAPLISQAGTAGTGTVTSAASSTATKKSAAGMTSVPSFNINLFGLGIYVSMAAVVGAGMVLL
ncbi:carbohydrate-binding module family 43 protein [Venturia nashicola]|uniref:1,3-beta-glucanosyltransferase n=1 Tax=Venturia nashicola TaxID=86259 RepID=A0A4Z1P1P3_9PEZI|nr:carbohydrate-binding module family 43 protein [Venturia nashicola]TLD20005.1 carbohydrate-binding module family 43 protein [Venturia nashicola]